MLLANNDKQRLFTILTKFSRQYQEKLLKRPLIGFEDQSKAEQRQILHSLQQGIPVPLTQAADSKRAGFTNKQNQAS